MSLKYRIVCSVNKKTKDGTVVCRIQAKKSFITICGRPVCAGDYGGFIESEDNLSQEGSCWVFDGAMVYNDARVLDNAVVRDFAIIKNQAVVEKDAIVQRDAVISDMARITDAAVVSDCAKISNRATIFGEARNNALVCGNANVHGIVKDNAFVNGSSSISGIVCDNAKVEGAIVVDKDSVVNNRTNIAGSGIIVSSTISCDDDTNIFSNYFNNGAVDCFINRVKINSPERVCTVPINFPGRTDECLTVANCSVCFHDTEKGDIYSVSEFYRFVGMLDIYEYLDDEKLSKRHKVVHQICKYIRLFHDYETLATNFLCMLKEMLSEEELKIVNKKEKVLHFYSTSYIFAQLISPLFWAKNMSENSDNNEYNDKHWDVFINMFANNLEINLKTKNIHDISKEAIVFNRELLVMIANICNFSEFWINKTLCNFFCETQKGERSFIKLFSDAFKIVLNGVVN